MKVKANDGNIYDSMSEAHIANRLRHYEIKYEPHVHYGDGKRKCDFELFLDYSIEGRVFWEHTGMRTLPYLFNWNDKIQAYKRLPELTYLIHTWGEDGNKGFLFDERQSDKVITKVKVDLHLLEGTHHLKVFTPETSKKRKHKSVWDDVEALMERWVALPHQQSILDEEPPVLDEDTKRIVDRWMNGLPAHFPS